MATTKPSVIVELESGYWNRGQYQEGTNPCIPQNKIQHLPVGTELYTKQSILETDQNNYKLAEQELIEWVEKHSSAGVPIPHLAFILQFRIWDINHKARVLFTQEPSE